MIELLQSLTVKNFAIIDNLSIDFHKGFTAITGETGAGKSLLIDAIGLLLGERASVSMIRSGEQKASIEGVFCELSRHTKDLLDEFDLLDDDDLLIIRRELYSNGKSLVRVNGSAINMGQVIQLAQTIADIHTQNDTKKLFEPKNYLSFIDDNTTLSVLKEYQNLRNHYLNAIKNYDEIVKHIENYHKEKEYLEYQYQNLVQSNLKKGELEALEEEYNMMNNFEFIFKNLTNIKKDLDENNINTILYSVYNSLEKLSQIDSKYQNMTEIVKNAYYDLSDISNDVLQNLNNLEFDANYFEEITERINYLKDLKYKYKMSIDELIEYRDNLELKLNMLDDDEYILNKAKTDVDEYYQITLQKALELSSLRKKNAKKLETNIKEALCDLMLDKVRLEIVFTNNLKEEKNPNIFLKNGIDIVNIMISFNPGENLMDLSKVASGGEMSRVMLAIKTHVMANFKLSTMIFDEIDSGVSGEVAYEVAKKLEQISKHTQVLAITHLPIVASKTNTQLYISKHVVSGKTLTMVKELNYHERIEELAKMISPTDQSGKSKELAKNMLNM